MKFPKQAAALLIIAVFATSIVNTQSANMAGVWNGQEPVVSSASQGNTCQEEVITVNDTVYETTYTQSACVTHGRDIDLAYTYIYNTQGANVQVGVKLKNDTVFTSLNSPGYVYLVPGTNKAIYDNNFYSARDISLFEIDDLTKAIYPNKYPDSEHIFNYYIDDYADRKAVFPLPLSSPWYKQSYGISKNGRYVMTIFANRGLFKADTKTGVVTKLLNSDGYPTMWGSNEYVKAVSDDGRFAFLGNRGLLVDAKDCGSRITPLGDYSDPDVAIALPCSTKDVSGGITASLPIGQYAYDINRAQFIGGSNDVEFDVQQWWIYGAPQQWRTIQLFAEPLESEPETEPETPPEPKTLEYLALGDSFSSGEGDNGVLLGEKHYRKGTDEKGPPQEKCHISTRSYPYLIANNQKLKDSDWNTIACSGALVGRDYYDSDSDRYFGQNGRLGGLNDDQVLQYQTKAKKELLPGRIRQIEFIKEYKPKIITLTGAGNDVGFSDILASCVDAFRPNETCTYAGDMDGKSKLGKSINMQYVKVRGLVSSIKAASPGSTIYYVGYPQFLKETNKTCGLGVSLSITERKVFRAANTYLNNVIKAAAESEGAIFVNVEDALNDHLLCGDDPYVTTYNADCSDSAVNWFKGKDECQESFHPKPAGHSLMARTILAAHPNIMDSQPCAPPNDCTKEEPLAEVKVPSVFKEASDWYNKSTTTEPVYGGSRLAAQKGNSNGHIQVETDKLLPNSEARPYLTSEPFDLGAIRVGPDGMLKIDEPVPDSVPAGYHTLHIEGLSESGEPIELWWTIRLFGREGDIDEDGTDDGVDKCIFMPTLNADTDGDGIDDGCDSTPGASADNASRVTLNPSAKRDPSTSPLLQTRASFSADMNELALNNASYKASKYIYNGDKNRNETHSDSNYIIVIASGMVLMGGLIVFGRLYGKQ